jgi:hypothetical protein
MIKRRLTPEEADQMIKQANLEFWQSGRQWLERQLKELREEMKSE